MRVVVVLLVTGENKVNSYSDKLNLGRIFKFGVGLGKLNEGCCSSSSCDWGKQSQLLLRPTKFGSGLQVRSGVRQKIFILGTFRNEVTDLHAHIFLLIPNHPLVAHQQLGFVVIQFSLKVHHLLFGISQVHWYYSRQNVNRDISVD